MAHLYTIPNCPPNLYVRTSEIQINPQYPFSVRKQVSINKINKEHHLNQSETSQACYELITMIYFPKITAAMINGVTTNNIDLWMHYFSLNRDLNSSF